MGNEEIYGKQVFKCDMLKAIELGLITDYRLHVVCVKGDEESLKKLAASKEVEDVEGTPFDVALACALKQVLAGRARQGVCVPHVHSRIAEDCRHPSRSAPKEREGGVRGLEAL